MTATVSNENLRPDENPKPAVSVIIPAYKVTAFIDEALQSVFWQTFGDYEVVIVNDGCPDSANLERVLAPSLHRVRYLRQENRGLSGARNAGIRAARGEFLSFLDADDVWERDYLKEQVNFLRSRPEVDVVYCDARFFGDTEDSGKRFMELFPSRGEVTLSSLITRSCNVFVSVTAKRDVILQHGLFDESLRSSEDYDLWLRLAAAGCRIAYQDRVLARYRRRKGSLSADLVWMAQSNLRVLKKAHDVWPDAPIRALIANRIDAKSAELHLEQAKRCFAAQDYAKAREELTLANSYYNRTKLRVVSLLLNVCPKALSLIHGLGSKYLRHR